MKKKWIGILAGATATVLTLGGLVGYTLWHDAQPKFHDVTVELGSRLPAWQDFMTKYAKESKVCPPDLESMDLSKAGVYELGFSHGKKTEFVTLTIVDTTAPILRLQNVSADIGTELKPEDFVQDVTDFSEVTLRFAKPLETPEGYGDVYVDVIATDASGNETQRTCTLSYVWMRSELTLELGGTASKGDILMNAEKDGDLLDQAALDALTTAPVGTYPITATTADGKTGTCQVTVVDTVAPSLKVKDVTVYDGETVTLEDFLVSATDLSGEVTTKLLQQPNTLVAGTSTITVEATDCNGNKTSADATLTVKKDTAAPVFSGLKKLSTDPNKKPNYTAGVSAVDDRDGQVSYEYDDSQVDLSKSGTYTVIYTAKDKAGNQAREERKVVVLSDTEAPKFSGLKDITAEKNQKIDYAQGVMAKDNWDGVVEFTYDDGKVNLSKAGTYYVTYSAKDKAGNQATSRRKVVVNHDQEDTDALIRDVASGLSSDPESIRDYVRNSIKYSSDWGGEDPVWFGLKNKKGNCLVHAKVLQELLEAKGYETKLIWVTDESHYWNLIKLNGTWKHIDATPGTRHTKYSLMNDEQRLETLQGRKWDTSQWPACE